MDISQRVLELMDNVYSLPRTWFEWDDFFFRGLLLPGWLSMYANKLYNSRMGDNPEDIDKLEAFLECKVPAYAGEAAKAIGYCVLAQYLLESLAR